ncbi:MAG: hypothetical protein AAGI37_20410 [Planctomycetota bacterium]
MRVARETPPKARDRCHNVVVCPQVFEQHSKVIHHANAMLVQVRIDRQGEVVHVKAFAFASLDERLTDLRDVSRTFR